MSINLTVCLIHEIRHYSKAALKERIKVLLSGVNRVPNALPLSTEDMVNLIEQHLLCKGSNRLPTLIVAAIFKTAKIRRAGNRQGEAVGDIQITFPGHEKMVGAL